MQSLATNAHDQPICGQAEWWMRGMQAGTVRMWVIERLHNLMAVYPGMTTGFALDRLRAYLNTEPDQHYADLIVELMRRIKSLRSPTVPDHFVRSFCAGKLGDMILARYDISAAEAFVLSYVVLQTTVTVTDLCWALGKTGLAHTVTLGFDNVPITDPDAVMDVMLKSLTHAKLIRRIDGERPMVAIGTNFSLRN